jgi:hypothetical protein
MLNSQEMFVAVTVVLEEALDLIMVAAAVAVLEDIILLVAAAETEETEITVLVLLEE